MTPRFAFSILVTLAGLLGGLVAGVAARGREYFPVAPSAMAHNFHTHVRVTGVVTYVQREPDGDRHFTVCESGTKKFSPQACIVAECIPSLPCSAPKIGMMVTVYGISRFDGEHKWWECHPVEKWEAVE